jgi:hypothetical protein
MTMALTSSHDTGRRASAAGAGTGRAGPLVWQRTDVVGTELVFEYGSDPRIATGSSVVAGAVPHTTRWNADLDDELMVRVLTVTCEGGGWARTLRLARDPRGCWSCDAEETGDQPAAPPPGIDDAGRLHPAAVARLADSPVFLSWALRHLRLTPGGRPASAPTLRIQTPSLRVVPGISTYQLLSPNRLRVTGDEPAATYDIDQAGTVTYRPARFRLAR